MLRYHFGFNLFAASVTLEIRFALRRLLAIIQASKTYLEWERMYVHQKFAMGMF